MAEPFLAGLVGFLIGRGISPQDATAIVEALRTYLAFEPPLGLTGYSLDNIAAGEEANAAVVVRGKTYDVVALADIDKQTQVSVLGKRGDRLEVAPTIEALKVVTQVQEARLIQDKASIEGTDLDVMGEANCLDGADTIVIQYTVPAGKTLLVYDWSAACEDADIQMSGYLRRDITWIGVSGGQRGFSVTLAKPKRVEAGKTLAVYVRHDAGAAHYVMAHFGGILI